VSVLALSAGPAVRKLERHGIPVCVIEAGDGADGVASDPAAVEAVAAHLAAVRADVVHNHMYRAEIVGTRAAWRVAEAGLRRPMVVGTVHSSRVRSSEDRELLRALTPRMDHLVAVSQANVHKIESEGRSGPPVTLIYNGVDLDRYDHQEPCCTLREEYGLPEAGPIVGVVARLEPEKGHPTLLEAWPAVLLGQPEATLLVIGEGSRREALAAHAASLGQG
jgi:glycosyltransferase involved in cell wall biosynthesis